MKRTNPGWKWALLPLFALALAAAAVLCLSSSYLHTDRQRLYLTPLVQDAKGWQLYTLTGETRIDLAPRELLDLEVGETFYLSRVLTEDLAQNYTSLQLDSTRPCSVFLDGELLYTTCPGAEPYLGRVRFPAGYASLAQAPDNVRCSLPAGCTGKTLTIATTHPVSEFAVSMPGVFFSSEAIDAETWMSTANHNSMPAAAFVTAALLLLGLLFYGLFQGGCDLSLLLLTGSALTQFFYYLRQYSFSSPTSTALDTPWAVFLPNLTVVLPMLYLTVQMRRRRLCAALVLAAAAISFIPATTNLFGYTITLEPFLLALYAGLLVLLACAVREAREKNRVFRLFLSGLGGICTCVLLLGLCSAAGEGYYSGSLVSIFRHWLDSPTLMLYWCGTILFVLCCIIGLYVLIQNATVTQTTLALQTERLGQLNHSLSVQKQFYEAKLTDEEELRALRHDMRGHFSTLATLLADGKAAEAAGYLDSLLAQRRERQAEVFCGEPYINVVLTTFAARFRENEIAFTYRGGVYGWTLPCVEVCLILNNALENALEAVLLLPQAERAVKVQAAVQKRQLLFRISNRFSGELQIVDGLPASTKTEKGHGYGLKNIYFTAKRLGGEVMYRVEDGFFVLDVRLPLPEGAEKGRAGYAV